MSKKKACTVTNGIFSYVSISLCEVLANYIQIGLHLNVLWDVNNWIYHEKFLLCSNTQWRLWSKHRLFN